ncbi:uncharacterized protein SPPG_05500 [Spizellomyces punctatus DAOM BR117]|uniref:Anti-proliferative protein domain-containing protein n=1 Tax=Spizellomyces punctatus (strain DAOM BR117) TaxID=645134 RepID=A0A0L0HE45_SPIPD|nr:uncharacterized protein SPPG_05500 [Spizellomyces punctatus DAOM BR117]KNC99244.1 hypothetical protein SPPG_05500 [Spizellomyces punctatus DAOM BR117]|eukprot:XP_016607284.1 hypothetical protein SPPG_05500 [Spizellomyces punctatus DAOM BR117]
MYTEVRTAATFLAKFLQSKSSSASATAERLLTFEQALVDRLMERFKGHWDPQRPCKGNAFRAVCVLNGVVDRVVVEALMAAGIKAEELNFPTELVLWIDPHCVSYRIGDFGQVVTVWENKTALDSDAVEVPHFFKTNNRTRSPSFGRSQAQTPPPMSQGQPQTPPPLSSMHPHSQYPYQKAVMAN